MVLSFFFFFEVKLAFRERYKSDSLIWRVLTHAYTCPAQAPVRCRLFTSPRSPACSSYLVLSHASAPLETVRFLVLFSNMVYPVLDHEIMHYIVSGKVSHLACLWSRVVARSCSSFFCNGGFLNISVSTQSIEFAHRVPLPTRRTAVDLTKPSKEGQDIWREPEGKSGQFCSEAQLENHQFYEWSLDFLGFTPKTSRFHLVRGPQWLQSCLTFLTPQLKIPVSGPKAEGHLHVSSSRDAPFQRYCGKVGGNGAAGELSDGNNPDSHFHL